jgi:sulfur-oxidizing protein SoxY
VAQEFRVEKFEGTMASDLTRRSFVGVGAGLASAVLILPLDASTSDNAVELIKQLTGKTPRESNRVHLSMPRVFPNGYTVPLTLEVDSPMTEADYVREVRVLAPQNPLIEVATFHFFSQRSEPHVSTRIRLAKPQHVLAVAEMNDGTLLMARAWVEVTTNGCA